MNQAQIDGITKARLTANIALAASGKPLHDDNAAYEAFVCESVGIDTLPDAAADSYAAQHAGKTVAALEAELADALEKADAAGTYPDGDTPVPVVAGVPQTITPAQGETQLLREGLLDAVTAALASKDTPAEMKIAFARATRWERTSPSVIAMMGMLGKTDADADAFFTAAAQIKL